MNYTERAHQSNNNCFAQNFVLTQIKIKTKRKSKRSHNTIASKRTTQWLIRRSVGNTNEDNDKQGSYQSKEQFHLVCVLHTFVACGLLI